MSDFEHDQHVDEVDELTGSETGRWCVSTRDSTHIFDFNAGTVMRIPGANATPGGNDRPRPLRSIGVCKVGQRGYWTMHTDGWSPTIDYHWHDTSVVRRIERLADQEPRAPHSDHKDQVAESTAPAWDPTAGDGVNEQAIDKVVSVLRDALGDELVVYIGGRGDTRIVDHWADGRTQPTADGIAQLRVAYRVTNLLKGKVPGEELSRWFAAPSRELGGASPAQLIREGELRAIEPIMAETARRFLMLS